MDKNGSIGMQGFTEALIEKLKGNLYNNFGRDNFDAERFGPVEHGREGSLASFKRVIKKSIGYKTGAWAEQVAARFQAYFDRLGFLYEKLDREDRALLLDIIAFRLLGYRKVKLPVNNAGYRSAIRRAQGARIGGETYDPQFLHFILNKYNLQEIGYDVQLFFSDVGIAIDFILEQYACKKNGLPVVMAEAGDTVLDVGGCWADTALYFAAKVGEAGRVYSFEFIPGNISLFNKNVELNPHLKDRIRLINRPVGEKSDIRLYFKDKGPSSKVDMQPFAGQTGETTSLSIDDFVEQNQIGRVDFIKMDIEGAEPSALRGAIRTIQRFRPKLAISIYHSMEDFVEIPQWIVNLDLGYELHLRHYTIHAEETVLFAKPTT